MALSIVEVLELHGAIAEVGQDALAAAFARRYRAEPHRGYGGTAHEILRGIGEGQPWRTAAGEAFSGMGSMGNGGAMRAAPVGAWFADDLERVVREARASAEVTHAHEEGQAGAIAVAVAAAGACRLAEEGRATPGTAILELALAHTPTGETRRGLRRALDLPFDRAPETAAATLGSGYGVISSDTVPFALWCAARHLGHYEAAMWATVEGLGDRDTTCAIAGGVVAMSTSDPLPPEWLAARESLPL